MLSPSFNSIKNNLDIFEPKLFFICLTVYFVCIPLIFLDHDLRRTITITVISVGCFAFLIGARTKKLFSLSNQKNDYGRTSTVLALMFALLDLFTGFQLLIGDISSEDYTERFHVTDFDAVYIQIPFLLLFTFKYFLFAVAVSKSKSIFYLIFFSQVLVSMTSPIRMVVLQPFIIFIVYGFYYGYIQLKFFKIILFLVLSPLIFSVLLLTRVVGGGATYFEVLSKVFDSNNFNDIFQLLRVALESFKSFEDLDNIIQTNFVHFESGIIRIFLTPISRSLWPDKPESISRIISKEFNNDQYNAGGGTVALIFGDAFINGHIIGIVLILSFLGYVSRILYNTMIKSILMSHSQKGIVIMMYSFFVYDFLYFYRGFFSEFLWKTLLIQLFFIFLYKLYFLRITLVRLNR